MSFVHRSIGPILFPSILWRTNESSVHLTFDDGPHDRTTPAVLEILRQRKIRATFFLVGNKVAQYPALAQQIANDGHQIGNHTYSHQSLFLKRRELQSMEIEKTNDIISKLLGIRPAYFRPPYGFFDHNTLKVAKKASHKVVMWDIDPRDFNANNENGAVGRIQAGIRPGSIILLHDNDSTERKITGVLKKIFDWLEERGIQISPLPV